MSHIPKRRVILFIIIFAAAAIGTIFGATRLAAVLQKDSSQQSQTSQINIDIRDQAYSQPDIKVSKGTTVTWTNRDEVSHNVMQQHEGEEHVHDAPARSEVSPDIFAGPLLAKGQSYSFTFNTAGTFDYHCAPHPDMQGKITVVE